MILYIKQLSVCKQILLEVPMEDMIGLDKKKKRINHQVTLESAVEEISVRLSEATVPVKVAHSSNSTEVIFFRICIDQVTSP